MNTLIGWTLNPTQILTFFFNCTENKIKAVVFKILLNQFKSEPVFGKCWARRKKNQKSKIFPHKYSIHFKCLAHTNMHCVCVFISRTSFNRISLNLLDILSNTPHPLYSLLIGVCMSLMLWRLEAGRGLTRKPSPSGSCILQECIVFIPKCIYTYRTHYWNCII